MSGKKTSFKEHTFFEKTWPFKVSGKSKTEILPPNNYEWPFDCILEGGLPESVEGLKDAWIIYRLKAEIGRRRAKDIVVRKPLRLVRTMDPSALELAHAMSVENIWPNKVEYSISIPSKAVVFGSFIRVDFKLIPLLKGLVIGTITTQIKEEQEFMVDPDWGVTALGRGQTKVDRTIAQDSYNVNPEQDEQVIDEAAEGYQFTRFLELPKTLNQCLQDCNVKGIKVRHKVKFNVQLHNPDGHISELRANLPVSFYISPSLPINANNDLVDQSPQAGRAAVENDLNNSAPPLYGEHTLDKLYSEVDPSGYLTPGIALSNPGTPYLHSRQASHENLRSLNALTNGSTGTSTPNGDSVSAAALQYRLQNLHVNGPTSGEDLDIQIHPASGEASRRGSEPHIDSGDYFSGHDSSASHSHPVASPNDANASSSSASMSRRVSEEDEVPASGARTPFPQYAHMEDLARVPSYSTAVKAPAPRRVSASAPDLPTYGDALTASTSTSPLAEPPVAHFSTNTRSRNASLVAGSPGSSGARTPMNRNVVSIQDDERRLRLMQMRGR
jgi:arrestin-related trafficking adapter 4/5/7